MKWGYCLYLLTCSITLLKAQDTADGCVSCAFTDFFKSSWQDWILPAADTLRFLVPDSTPAPETTIPKDDPDSQRTNDFPGRVDQPDIELQNIVSSDKECNPTGTGVSDPRGADRFTITTLTIFFSILVNVMRRGNSSNNLAVTCFLRRRGPSHPDLG